MSFETSGPAKYKQPSLLVAVSTSIPQYKSLYSQAKELSKYMTKTMKFQEIGVLHSSAFPPEVIVADDGIATLPACRLYLHRGRSDILLFAGDASPMDDQYAFTKTLLEFAAKAGVKEVYSVGARWSETPAPAYEEPKLKGFATDRGGVKRLKDAGVEIISNEPAPFFASLVVGLAKDFGMRGYKVSVDHGEPVPHTRSVIKMLEVLSSMMGFEVDMKEIKSQVRAPPQERPPGAGAIYQ